VWEAEKLHAMLTRVKDNQEVCLVYWQLTDSKTRVAELEATTQKREMIDCPSMRNNTFTLTTQIDKL